MTTRVSQACQRCQRRKLKCDGQLQCSACRTANQSCLYGNANRKRGLAEGYVRGLERLLGFAIKRDSSLTTDIQKHLRLNECERPETPSVSQETMLESWKHSIVAKDVELLLPTLERNEARHWQSLFADTARVESRSVTDANPPMLIDPDLSHSVDPALDEDRPNHSPDSINAHVASFGDSGDKDVAHVSELALAEVHAHPPFSGIQHQLPMKLPDNSKKIIDAYLAYTNCWFPILEPHELLRTFHQYRLSGDECYRSSDELGQVAVLWAVLAYETCKGGGFAAPFDGDLHGHPTYKTARQLIPVEEEDHQLGHTQALLILALINLGHGHWKACWLLVGYALRLMQYHDNKHDTKDQNGDARPQIRGSRQAHTLTGCFIFEKLLAMRMRKILLGSHASRPPALPEDGLEEWETPRFPDLITRSQYKPSAEVPGRILSTFNRLSSTIDYLGNLPLTVQRDHLNMSDPRHEPALETLQSSGPQKDHESDPDSYPQFLLSCLVNQCVLLAVTRQKIWVPQTDQPGSVTPDANCLEPLIRFSCAIRDFERTHGAGRVPVMLVAICSRMIEDLVILAKIPQLWTKSATISAVDAVVSSMQKFGRIWPAFRHLGKTVSSIKAASNLGRQHPAVLNPSLLQHPSHLASDTGCIHAGSVNSPPLVAACAAIGSSSTSGAFAGVTESEAQNSALAGPGAISAMESQPQAANIFEDAEMLTGGVNDVYFQLAQADMMEWSGNWQQEGLQTLGFDNNSFERLYSIGQ